MKLFLRYYPFLLLGGLLSFSGCGNDMGTSRWTEVLASIPREFPEVQQITTQEFAAWVRDRNRPPPMIFDTREEEEFVVSHILNARYLNPGSNIVTALGNLDKSTPIVVYCSVGYRSSKMARKLQQAGFSHVYNLEGSIFKWANEGNPVVQGDRPATHVHPYDANWGKLLNEKLRAPWH